MARRRVNGPYRHGHRWRIVLVGEDGTQHVESFGSKDDAEAAKQDAEREREAYESVTVSNALEQYELHLRSKGNKPRSRETTLGRIRKMLDELMDARLSLVTEAMMLGAYEGLRAASATDTHRNALNETKTFVRWCAAKPRRWVDAGLLDGIKGEGKRKKGKPQLRIDESRRFLAEATRRADAGDVAGVVGMAALYFGTRITELVSRPVRDLDDDGWLLWIPDSKTENGRRFLEVPSDLRDQLLRLAAGKLPDSPLFTARRGRPISRFMARAMVQAVCRSADVPVVSPHGLRGTHATIARERGVTPSVIAAAVGHGSYDAVTAQHYVAPGTDDRARAKAALGVLAGGRK